MDSPLKLYNTLGRQLQTFTPLRKDGVVGLYTCGPTVYAPQHIGNMRYFIFTDVLKKTLLLDGYSVKHVMNITDVGHLTSDADTGEDKIEKAAREQGGSARQIAARHEQVFWHDLKALNIQPPNEVLHAASDEPITWQIDLINRLEAKGLTYRTSDGIYFDTSKFPRYGQLSGQRLADKKAGVRVEVRSAKKHPTDFALWKFSQPLDKRQMEWSAFGRMGFPGWHLECSAISMHELGEQFDIHTGGVDHIPVHHENEIAQSEAATGKHPFVNIWMHGEFLILPGKRMGKSEGNAITLQDVVDRGIHPLAFRYLVLQAQYRQPLSFTWAALEAANTGLQRLWDWIGDQLVKPNIGCAEFEQQFTAAVSDDLDTPAAVAILHKLLASDYPPEAKLQTLSVMDQVLELDVGVKKTRQHLVTMTPELSGLLQQREAARTAKQWTEADRWRGEIEQQGFHIDDTPAGPRLRKK